MAPTLLPRRHSSTTAETHPIPARCTRSLFPFSEPQKERLLPTVPECTSPLGLSFSTPKYSPRPPSSFNRHWRGELLFLPSPFVSFSFWPFSSPQHSFFPIAISIDIQHARSTNGSFSEVRDTQVPPHYHCIQHLPLPSCWLLVFWLLEDLFLVPFLVSFWLLATGFGDI